MKPKTYRTWLPCFPGFYETDLWNYDTDDATMQGVLSGVAHDCDFPMELLKRWCNRPRPVCRDLEIRTDRDQYMEDMAREYCRVVADALTEIMDTAVTVVYEELCCPREYNFRNDSVNCRITFDAAEAVRRCRESLPAFREYLAERYTSGSGFTSWYSTDPEDWMDPKTWKCHEPGAVLQFLLLNEDPDAVAHLNENAKCGDVYYADYITVPDELEGFLWSEPVREIVNEYRRLVRQGEAYIGAMGGTERSRKMVADATPKLLEDTEAALEAAEKEYEFSAEIAG